MKCQAFQKSSAGDVFLLSVAVFYEPSERFIQFIRIFLLSLEETACPLQGVRVCVSRAETSCTEVPFAPPGQCLDGDDEYGP